MARAILAAGEVKTKICHPITQEWPQFFGLPRDADKFEIKPSSDEKTSTSRSHKDWGQARASVILPKPTEITVALSAADVEVFSMAFQGMVQDFSQAAGNLAAVEVTVPALNVWIPLGKRNLSDTGLLVTSEDAATTYALGTHYEINWLRGQILFKAGPAPTSKVKITAAYGAEDGKRILGGRVSQIRCAFEFNGVNMVDNTPIEVDVYEAIMTAENGFDFLASDFTPITLKGKIVTPAGKTEGYEVRYLTANA